MSVAAGHHQAGTLPALLDTRGIMREMGVTRSVAESIIRKLDPVKFDGIRKLYVYRDDVKAYLEASTRRRT